MDLIKNLINAIANDNTIDSMKYFESAVHEKVAAAIQDKKEQVGASLFGESIELDEEYNRLNENEENKKEFGDDWETRRDIARNPATSKEHLVKLANDHHEDVRVAVAENKNSSDEAIHKLSTKPTWTVVNRLLNSDKTKQEHFDKIVKHTTHPSLSHMIINNKRFELSKDNITHLIKNKVLGKDEYTNQYNDISDKPNFSSKEHLPLISKDKSVAAKEALARHKDTPTKKLDTLVNDKSHTVRAGVARNPSATKEHLDKLVGDSKSEVRAGVARNPSATKEHLDKLVGDSKSEVRRGVAEHPSATKEHLDKIVKNDDALGVVDAVAKNPNATKEHKQIANDRITAAQSRENEEFIRWKEKRTRKETAKKGFEQFRGKHEEKALGDKDSHTDTYHKPDHDAYDGEEGDNGSIIWGDSENKKRYYSDKAHHRKYETHLDSALTHFSDGNEKLVHKHLAKAHGLAADYHDYYNGKEESSLHRKLEDYHEKKAKEIKESIELDEESNYYHSVWVKDKKDTDWSHHFDADNKEDAASEKYSCKNNGEKCKVIRVHKGSADWTNPEHRKAALAKLNEESEELDEGKYVGGPVHTWPVYIGQKHSDVSKNIRHSLVDSGHSFTDHSHVNKEPHHYISMNTEAGHKELLKLKHGYNLTTYPPGSPGYEEETKSKITESEEITELSKKTLADYVKKASKDQISQQEKRAEYKSEAKRHGTRRNREAEYAYNDAYKEKTRIGNNRVIGISQAVDKLAKE